MSLAARRRRGYNRLMPIVPGLPVYITTPINTKDIVSAFKFACLFTTAVAVGVNYGIPWLEKKLDPDGYALNECLANQVDNGMPCKQVKFANGNAYLVKVEYNQYVKDVREHSHVDWDFYVTVKKEFHCWTATAYAKPDLPVTDVRPAKICLTREVG